MRNSIYQKHDFKAIGQDIKAAHENMGLMREQLDGLMDSFGEKDLIVLEF